MQTKETPTDELFKDIPGSDDPIHFLCDNMEYVWFKHTLYYVDINDTLGKVETSTQAVANKIWAELAARKLGLVLEDYTRLEDVLKVIKPCLPDQRMWQVGSYVVQNGSASSELPRVYTQIGANGRMVEVSRTEVSPVLNQTLLAWIIKFPAKEGGQQ